jgi:LCP family protein required for cell wall assembly
MLKKTAVIIFLIGVLVAAVSVAIRSQTAVKPENRTVLSPFADIKSVISPEQLKKDKSVFRNNKNLNVLLIGTDTSLGRRERGQLGFNTDSMILVSVNPEKNRVLLTSVPRDLWINNNKINALFILYGWDTLKDAFEKITGQTLDGYIIVDFDGLEWVVNSFGGVPVEIVNSFTDYEFPDTQDSATVTVSFLQGQEKMSGERALTFARSRKGNNGEGSDLMRGKRQHLILKGMLDAISQPESIFWPVDIPKFFDAVTQHMETSLTLDDVYYLWDFYKDREKYQIESFIVGNEYLYYPGMYPDSPYRAWVFVPIGDSFLKLQNDIKAKLDGTFVSASAPSEITSQ